MMVLGKRSWSLNTDIPSSKDEAQPYTVFTREEIKRSGAPDLDTFFRDFLGANTSVSTAGQRNSRDSQIDLRGLGLDGTLILVDGRRIADPNVGPGGLKSGAFLQSRSEEHTSELQSLMRNSSAVFCLTKKKYKQNIQLNTQ